MKVLFSGCLLDGDDKQPGGTRLERNIKYIKYYMAIREEIGFDMIWLMDNQSSKENVQKLLQAVGDGGNKLQIFTTPKKLISKVGGLDYPYCWAPLFEMCEMMKKVGTIEKAIAIDSDCFVVSKTLAKHIRYTNSGWSTLWCPKYNFPESAFQIICEDAKPLLNGFFNFGWERHNGKMMETTLPFTQVNKGFNANRFGEWRQQQDVSMDYYGQARVDQTLIYNMRGE
jgi:hypothetical protein